jgi:FtsH-binding integral membrane protein
MSIYGYTTKRDLTKLGSFLMMGLIGIIIASIVNIFMQSSMMYFVISILGVLIFVGLTAYDTQKIKNMYAASDTGEIMGKKAVMGALTLYSRLYKFIYNVVKIIWPKKIILFL